MEQAVKRFKCRRNGRGFGDLFCSHHSPHKLPERYVRSRGTSQAMLYSDPDLSSLFAYVIIDGNLRKVSTSSSTLQLWQIRMDALIPMIMQVEWKIFCFGNK